MVREWRTSVPGEGHSSGELAGVERGGRSGYQFAGGRIRPQGQEQLQQISEHQGGYQSGGRSGYQSGRRGGHTGGRGGRGPPAPQYPRGSATPQPGPSRPRSSDLHQATVLPYQVAPNNSKLPFWRPTESLGDDSSSSHALQQHPIGEGLESWSGFHQSIRHTQTGISLNIDVSLNAFIEPLPVIEYVAQLLNKRDISSSQPLSDADHVKIKKALRGIKVEVTHRGEMRRKYRICGLTSQATWELTFPVDERGTLKSVVEYFHETYKSIIHYTWLPCLLVGNQQRPVYMPMEVCKIVPGQRYSKRLNKGQIAALLRETSQRPQERKTNINKIVDQIDYAKDEYAREFGTEISPVMVQVAARVLPAPQKVVNGGIVNHWICVNFASRVNDYTAFEFCQELAKICSNSGMTFQRKPVMLPVRANSNEVESVLKDSFQNAMTRLQGKELDLLIVILPDKNGSLNGDLKRICETDLGLVYQCCLAEQVLKDRQKQHQYLVNLSLKINVKVGGRNTVLADAPCIEGEGEEEGHVFPLKH